jgi:hypothetical protein
VALCVGVLLCEGVLLCLWETVWLPACVSLLALILCTCLRPCLPHYPPRPLSHTRYLVEDEYGQVWTGGSTYADLPIHMHMANSFLFGRNRVVFFNGMHSPVFAGEVRRCPVLS